MINLAKNKEYSIQDRLNRLKQSNQNKLNLQTPPPKNANIQDFLGSPPQLIEGDSINSSEFNTESIKNQFTSALSSGNVSKDKFGYFIQKANEMFQNYELQLSEFKKRTSYFDYKYLTISNSRNDDGRNFYIQPKKKDKVMSEIRKLTEEELHTLEEIKEGFTDKICNLLVENENLSRTMEKIRVEVIDKLQERIYELGEINRQETSQKIALENQLCGLESVFQQNEEMKNTIKKDKETIEKMEKYKNDNEMSLMELSLQISALKNEIKIRRETIEKKNIEIGDLNKKINDLNNEVSNRDKTISLREGTIKEKESEIQLLCNNNIEWEEKFNLKCKEIENFKKWSLWDQDIIESFKRIETLLDENGKKDEKINLLNEESTKLKSNNSELSNELEELKKELNKLKEENESLTHVKQEYEKQKIKYEEYVEMEKEFLNLKKEQKEIADKFESEIKTSSKNFEIQINNLKRENENKIETQKREYEKEIKKIKEDAEVTLNEKKNMINDLENKMKTQTEFTEEAKAILERKNQAVQNISDAYDILKKKFAEKEDMIKKLLEKGNFQSHNSQNVIFNDINSPSSKTEENTKLYSTFDKFSFTKSIMIDYLFCLYLLENTITLQNITGNLIGNLNLYLLNIFVNQNKTLHSLHREFLEDLFYFSFDILIKKRFEQYPEDRTNPELFKINFEDFDRGTLVQISKELLKRNFVTSVKTPQNFDNIKKLFVQKYTKLCDFDQDLGKFVEEQISPAISIRLDRYSQNILDSTLTLVDLALHNIKNGKVIVNDKEIYSFEKFFSQYQNQRISPVGVSSIELELYKKFELNEEFDNVIHIVKVNRLNGIILNKCFEENTKKEGLNLIFSSILLYNNKLQSLSLNRLNLTGEEFIEPLIKVLGVLKELQMVDLSENLINEADVKIISNYLKADKNIKCLKLNNNRIISAGGYYLADALTKNKILEQLFLDCNKINEGGFSSLLNVLSNNNNTIKVLSIEDNELTPEDFHSLANYLSSGPALQSLDISGNKITSESANIIGSILKRATNLKTIKLNRMELNEDSSSQFLIFLPETNIEEVELDGNLFELTGPVAVLNKVKASNQVRNISLKHCEINSTFLDILSKAMPFFNSLECINLEQNTFDNKSFMNFCKEMEIGNKVIVKFSKLLLINNAEEIARDKPNIKLL